MISRQTEVPGGVATTLGFNKTVSGATILRLGDGEATDGAIKEVVSGVVTRWRHND